MTSRTLMAAVLALIVGSILSILAVQYFSPDESAKSTTPPDPLIVSPENAAEETNSHTYPVRSRREIRRRLQNPAAGLSRMPGSELPDRAHRFGRAGR